MTDHSSDSPYRKPHKPAARKPAKKHASQGRGSNSKRSRSGRRGKGGGGTEHHLTSHPTTRSAQVNTRAWLLDQYGPQCAYCGERFTAQKMTLDHVAPRRGQTAYDRRDNLVLACKSCNQAKRDQSPLAFLLGVRTRAVHLVKYGAHLSQGLLEMARSLIPTPAASSGRDNIDYSKWGPPSEKDDDDSPYRR